GIYNYDAGMTNAVLRDNSITNGATGIFMNLNSGNVLIEGGTVSDHWAGGIFGWVDQNLDITIQGVTLNANDCYGDSDWAGGAIRLLGTDDDESIIRANILDCDINMMSEDGGAIKVGSGDDSLWEAYAVIRNVQCVGGDNAYGGAVRIGADGTTHVEIYDSSFTGFTQGIKFTFGYDNDNDASDLTYLWIENSIFESSGGSKGFFVDADESIEMYVYNSNFLLSEPIKVGFWYEEAESVKIVAERNAFKWQDGWKYGIHIKPDETIDATFLHNTFQYMDDGSCAMIKMGWCPPDYTTTNIGYNTFINPSGIAVLVCGDQLIDADIYGNVIEGIQGGCTGAITIYDYNSNWPTLDLFISGNRITNYPGDGIYVYSSNWDRIIKAEISHNVITGADGYGMHLWDLEGADIHHNTITSSSGIYLEKCDNSRIYGNTFKNNDRGLYINPASDFTSVYGNVFMGNTLHAESDNIDTTWNLPYADGGGNYWDDWLAPDSFSGPNQDIPGEDGFVDLGGDFGGLNPRPIDGVAGQEDTYPLSMGGGINVTILNPAAGQTLTGFASFRAQITVSLGTVDPDSVMYSINAGWQPLNPEGWGFYTAFVDTDTLSDGQYVFTVRASDMFGNTAEDQVIFRIYNYVPPPPVIVVGGGSSTQQPQGQGQMGDDTLDAPAAPPAPAAPAPPGGVPSRNPTSTPTSTGGGQALIAGEIEFPIAASILLAMIVLCFAGIVILSRR
ncbi:MAG: NosD domain-containing protein, partial [Candidatus Thermoplasmatota archaeon]|nr:NosD domain-containing protein [Candidatus Thermoplasmatota archaeon]